MIKIARDAAVRWPFIAAELVWRRIQLLGYAGRRVRTKRGSSVWMVSQQGTSAFAGTKQQCEDWLDWQDQRVRKRSAHS